MDRENLAQRIQQREFDLVIFANGDTEGPELLRWKEVSDAGYNISNTVLIDGSDALYPGAQNVYTALCGKNVTCFRRELVGPHELPKSHPDVDEDVSAHATVSAMLRLHTHTSPLQLHHASVKP